MDEVEQQIDNNKLLCHLFRLHSNEFKFRKFLLVEKVSFNQGRRKRHDVKACSIHGRSKNNSFQPFRVEAYDEDCKIKYANVTTIQNHVSSLKARTVTINLKTTLNKVQNFS